MTHKATQAAQSYFKRKVPFLYKKSHCPAPGVLCAQLIKTGAVKMSPVSLKFKSISFASSRESQPDCFLKQGALRSTTEGRAREKEHPQPSERFITYDIPIYLHIMLLFKTLTPNRLFFQRKKKQKRDMSGPC